MKPLDFLLVIMMLGGEGVTWSLAALNPSVKVSPLCILGFAAAGFIGTATFFGRMGERKDS